MATYTPPAVESRFGKAPSGQEFGFSWFFIIFILFFFFIFFIDGCRTPFPWF